MIEAIMGKGDLISLGVPQKLLDGTLKRATGNDALVRHGLPRVRDDGWGDGRIDQ